MEIARCPKDIGPLLRQRRKQRNLTLADVANGARMAVSSLSDIERGACMPSIETLFHLCRCLGLSLWLESDDKPESDHC